MPFSLDIMQWAVPAQLLQLTPELQRMLQVHSFVSFILFHLFCLSIHSLIRLRLSTNAYFNIRSPR